MEPNRVEINPGPGGVVVTINGAILPGATIVFVDGNRLDFVDGRVVVSLSLIHIRRCLRLFTCRARCSSDYLQKH